MSIRKGDSVIAGASVGFVRKPAWSQAVAISAADLYAGYTAPADGMFICAKSRPNNYTVGLRTITINNIPIIGGDYSEDGRYSYGDCSCTVNKGDLIKANANNAWEGESRIFVPFEYSGVSDIEVVTPEYIRNQNILSDWENIVLSSSGLHPTIMQYDGIVTVYAKAYTTSNNFAYIRVNGVACNSWFMPNGFSVSANILAVSAVVKKGDEVTVHFPANSSPSAQARFYKLRDYSGR